MAHDYTFRKRYEVRAKDLKGDWCFGYLKYDYLLDRYSVYNVDGECEVDPSTLCRHTGYVERTEDLVRREIFEGDIVEFITHGGSRYCYLLWFCQEMNCICPLEASRKHDGGVTYWICQTDIHSITYEDFAFRMQDPWGDFKQISVVGNLFDNAVIFD
jgi:hypothetical protein